MASTQPGTFRRALVAALALYGLVVAGFVSGLSPVAAAPSQMGVICGHEAAPASPPKAPCDHGTCCVLACAAAFAGAAFVPGAVAPAWPARSASAVRWASRPVAAHTLRTAIRLNARGPPAA